MTKKSCEWGSYWTNEGILTKLYENISYSWSTNWLHLNIMGSKVKITENIYHIFL